MRLSSETGGGSFALKAATPAAFAGLRSFADVSPRKAFEFLPTLAKSLLTQTNYINSNSLSVSQSEAVEEMMFRPSRIEN